MLSATHAARYRYHLETRSLVQAAGQGGGSEQPRDSLRKCTRASEAQALANAGPNDLARGTHPTGRPSRTADCKAADDAAVDGAAVDDTAARSRIAPCPCDECRSRDRGARAPAPSHPVSHSANHTSANHTAPKIPLHARSSFGPGASPTSGCFRPSLRPVLPKDLHADHRQRQHRLGLHSR